MTFNADVVLYDQIGGAFTIAATRERGLGGSELEMIQVAHGLAERGHKVVVCNGVEEKLEIENVTYAPRSRVSDFLPTKAFYFQRSSMLETPTDIALLGRIVVRANDIYCPPYDVHREMLGVGAAALVGNTKWQTDQFAFAKERIVIPPILDPTPEEKKVPGLFVYASGPMKGLVPTLNFWRAMKEKHAQVMKKAKLAIVSPGWGDYPPLTQRDKALGMSFVGDVTSEEYRGWIAKAEGLFMVLMMTEVFCCAAAIAERAGTRTHILCKAGLGGLGESLVNHSLVVENEIDFAKTFLEAWQSTENRERFYAADKVEDRTRAAIIPRWEEALRLGAHAPAEVSPAEVSSEGLTVRPVVRVGGIPGAVPDDTCSLCGNVRDLKLPSTEKAPKRADGRPTVGLVLITIGNEAQTVAARAVVSAFKMVDAVTVVIDPHGGGEQTAEVLQHIGADVYMRPSPKIDWERGIGTIAGARNEALAIAESKTDYVLMLDADDTLEGKLPDVLDKDFYEVMIQDGGIQYPRVQLWRSALRNRYEGIVHEVPRPTVMRGNLTLERLTTLTYHRRFGGGHQDSVPREIKYGRHARLLEVWMAMHPEDSRGQFYLGQSYRDMGPMGWEKATTAYERRIEMQKPGQGFDEERAFAAVQIARIIRESNKDPTAAYLRAYEMRPSRAEPLYELAVWLRLEDRKRFALGRMVARQASEMPFPSADHLFLDSTIYQWRALEEYAVHSYWSGDKKEAARVYDELLVRTPDWNKEHIAKMRALCR
jgi:hypothetical protein